MNIFEKTGFNDDKVDEYLEMFIKYSSRYSNVKDEVLKTINNSEELRKKTLDDLSKTNFNEKGKKKLFDAIMRHNYIVDIDDVIVASVNTMIDDNDILAEKINKTLSEKTRNTLKEKHTSTRKEIHNLKEKSSVIREIDKKMKKEADKAKEKIQKNIKKNEKRR